MLVLGFLCIRELYRLKAPEKYPISVVSVCFMLGFFIKAFAFL